MDVKAEAISVLCVILPINMAGEIQEERKQKPMLQRAKYNALVSFPLAMLPFLYTVAYMHGSPYNEQLLQVLVACQVYQYTPDVEMQLRNNVNTLPKFNIAPEKSPSQ